IMFLFPKGTKVDSGQWPCPKVKESNGACKDAFWPDGDAKRKNGDTKREYKVTRDTMACRFYDRFARRSPCEGKKTKSPHLYVTVHPLGESLFQATCTALVVKDMQGNQLRSLPASEAISEGHGILTWRLPLAGLPSLVHLYTLRGGYECLVGTPFDPAALGAALAQRDLGGADAAYTPLQNVAHVQTAAPEQR
ncbi:MAG: hypothetical protein ACRELB_18060, partial [Polyangiaceae bacterium]